VTGKILAGTECAGFGHHVEKLEMTNLKSLMMMMMNKWMYCSEVIYLYLCTQRPKSLIEQKTLPQRDVKM